ncbi:MAG: LamG domain-containing protein, partial [Burkholderiales bacterium]|nr:LamG domain-containing protein [Burkholderiales bacterium]
GGGRASLSLLYADAGRIAVDASYSGSGAEGNAGLSLTGSVSAVVAPQDFEWTDLPAGAQRAGMPFGALLRARNAAGAVTPNFGLEGETVQLSHQRRSPTGAGAVDGSLSTGASTLSAGTFRYAELRWSEVGRIDLSASLVGGSYLGSGMNVLGNTGVAGAIGPFRPHHLRVGATEACGGYSYAGQPFGVTVSARNASEAVTLNYFSGGGHARDLSFTDAGAPALGLGSISPAALPASAFSAGEASTQLAYVFTSKASGPGSLLLRATDSDGVSSSAQAGADDSMSLRSGRLVLQSALGSAQRNLSLPMRLEHWRNGAWVVTSDDTCTVPSGAWHSGVAQSGRVGAGGAPAGWSSPVQSISLSAGVGSVVLAAPNASGAVDLALNLGSSASDRACLAGPRPTTTGLGLPWLRSRQGSVHGCGTREDSDPSGRASFGAPAGQANKVHERVID